MKYVFMFLPCVVCMATRCDRVHLPVLGAVDVKGPQDDFVGTFDMEGIVMCAFDFPCFCHSFLP